MGSLTTTMTVKVAEVRSDGMVVLRGEREVKIDDEIQTLKFEGKARAQDIRGDNTINSSRVADARIAYEGKLGLAEGEARGWLDSGYLYIKNTLFW
jgi:flagellar L-ring protein precursor FlgH